MNSSYMVIDKRVKGRERKTLLMFLYKSHPLSFLFLHYKKELLRLNWGF